MTNANGVGFRQSLSLAGGSIRQADFPDLVQVWGYNFPLGVIYVFYYTFFLTWPLVYDTALVYLRNIYEFQGFRLCGAHYYTRFNLLSLCDYIPDSAKE